MENYQKTINEPYKKKLPKFIVVTGNILFSVIIICMIVYIGFNFIYEYHPVHGYSMSPTFNDVNEDEDGVYINTRASYKRGDVIVSKSPESNAYVIKRLIALQFDKVAIKNELGVYNVYIIKDGSDTEELVDFSFLGELTDNGTYIDFQSYLMNHLDKTELINSTRYLIIPENCYFYLGDNMKGNESEDCADYGPVLTENYIGVVRFVIYNRTNHFKQIVQQIFK